MFRAGGMWNDQIGINSVFGLFQKTPVDNSIVNGAVLISKKKVMVSSLGFPRGDASSVAGWNKVAGVYFDLTLRLL